MSPAGMGGRVQCVSDMQTTVRGLVGRGGGGGGRWRDLKVEARERRRWRGSVTIRGAGSGSGLFGSFLKSMDTNEGVMEREVAVGGRVPLPGTLGVTSLLNLR